MKISLKVSITIVCFFVSTLLYAQPSGYYNSASGLTQTQLQQALHDIIDNHTELSYTPGVWNAVKISDKRADGTVWDMYSDNPTGTNPYNYTFGSDQCGNYSSEGDCYNREHSFPKSWFNAGYPMYTDLNHVFPTDGKVNGQRGNFPFGETNSATWTSRNGSKRGNSSISGYTGTIFEPIDEYKGDFARAHLYIAVRYYGEDSSWEITDMTNKSQPKPWALTMLLKWHTDDPVSQKEINRNNEVYKQQNNRNPFIDEPTYATKIWSSDSGINEQKALQNAIYIFQNPTKDELKFSFDAQAIYKTSVKIISSTGIVVFNKIIELDQVNIIDIRQLTTGYYILIINSGNKIHSQKFVKL